jgi:hypothetical protein
VTVGGGAGGAVLVDAAAATIVGRTETSHSRATAEPRLPVAKARMRNRPACKAPTRSVPPSPDGTPLIDHAVCTVSPDATASVRMTKSIVSSSATSSARREGVVASTRGGRGASTRTPHERRTTPIPRSTFTVTRCVPTWPAVGANSQVAASSCTVPPSRSQATWGVWPGAAAPNCCRWPIRRRSLRADGLTLTSGWKSAVTSDGKLATTIRAASPDGHMTRLTGGSPRRRRCPVGDTRMGARP